MPATANPIIMIDEIKKLREETGASIGQIRQALEKSGGDAERAREVLRANLGAIAGKKSAREVHSGLVDAYVHSNGRIGVLVELHCETDFVARNSDFRGLAHDIAMHIAAMAPADEETLKSQEFVRDPSRKIGDLLQEAIGKFGENIKIGNFARFEL